MSPSVAGAGAERRAAQSSHAPFLQALRAAGRLLFVAGLLGQPRPALAGDPVVTLAEAQQHALATHDRIRAADAGREKAAVAPWRAVSALAPSVRESASYTREKEEIAFPSDVQAALQGLPPVVIAQDVVRNVLSVGQPLYTHQFWALRDIGDAEVKRSDEVYRAARQDVLLAVTAAYYDELRARALDEVARQTEGLTDVEIEHARARVRAGEAVESDVLRVQTERARVTQRTVETSGLVETSHDVLRRLASLKGPFSVTEPAPRKLDIASVEPFLEAARTRNPNLKELEAQVDVARGEEERRAAALYPTLGLEFNYQNLNHDTFADRNDFWNLVVRAQVPIFEAGGSRWLDLSEQRAVVAQTRAELSGFERDLEVNVRRAWVTARTLEARRIAAEEELRLANDTYRMLSDQYTAGVATNLDVLTALNTLATARANVASTRYAEAVARVQLERVAGTLGEVEP
ncbi:MAG TPA: TolC family protein [Candidatus Binatia bacterium]|nr:TolC family protein [Candidatus Binatia bacterium]